MTVHDIALEPIGRGLNGIHFVLQPPEVGRENGGGNENVSHYRRLCLKFRKLKAESYQLSGFSF
jgi:hypothetical protein